jgi:hypothetical protein
VGTVRISLSILAKGWEVLPRYPDTTFYHAEGIGFIAGRGKKGAGAVAKRGW